MATTTPNIIVLRVDLAILNDSRTKLRSFFCKDMSDEFIAISLAPPTVIPTSAVSRAIVSLIPSPTKAIVFPCFWISLILFSLSFGFKFANTFCKDIPNSLEFCLLILYNLKPFCLRLNMK